MLILNLGHAITAPRTWQRTSAPSDSGREIRSSLSCNRRDPVTSAPRSWVYFIEWHLRRGLNILISLRSAINLHLSRYHCYRYCERHYNCTRLSYAVTAVVRIKGPGLSAFHIVFQKDEWKIGWISVVISRTKMLKNR